MVGRLGVIHEWQIQDIQPNHGFVAIVSMLMPQARWREDQITSGHQAFLALHGGVCALTFNHHSNRIGRMAVRGSQLTGQKQLHAQINGGTGLHLLQAMPRIGKHQNAALGFFDGRDLSGLHQKRSDIFVIPSGGLGQRSWPSGWQNPS